MSFFTTNSFRARSSSVEQTAEVRPQCGEPVPFLVPDALRPPTGLDVLLGGPPLGWEGGLPLSTPQVGFSYIGGANPTLL